MHYYTYYRNGDIQVREPLSPGHEAAGIILAVGPGVEGLEVGDKVALEVGVPCDECEDCHAGAYNICEKLRFRSSATKFPHYQGTLQERLNHPSKWVHKSEPPLSYTTSFIELTVNAIRLPADMDLAYGALLEPLAVGIHAVNKAEAEPGNNCLIIGAGAVGLLCAIAAKAAGYKNIVMADIARNRLDFALENKFADATQSLEIRKETSIEHGLELVKQDAAALTVKNNGNMFHRVFECTGVESCVRTSIYVSPQSEDHSRISRILTLTRQHVLEGKSYSSAWVSQFKRCHYQPQLCERFPWLVYGDMLTAIPAGYRSWT